MGYRVKTVSAMTGIPRGTLLAWERRYEILEPDRSPSGYREYSEADVAVLRRLKALVDDGYSISEAVALVKRPAEAEPAAPAGGAEAAPPAEGEAGRLRSKARPAAAGAVLRG
ncbi:MAG: MerR family transcriptional regulator [Myxococcota bacterium]